MVRQRLKVFGLTCLLLGATVARHDPAGAQAAPPEWSGPAGRIYDPQTVETVEGTVASVDREGPSRRGGTGVHLVLQTAGGPLAVHLGPAWFIDRQTLRVAPGDALKVTGSRVDVGGEAALIARSITKGGETLVLRDEAGRPVWAGQRPPGS